MCFPYEFNDCGIVDSTMKRLIEADGFCCAVFANGKFSRFLTNVKVEHVLH